KDRSSGVPTDTPSPNQQPTKRARPSLDTREKLHKFFDLLHELDWTLGEFLYHVFAHKDEDNNTIHRSARHGIICQHFLSGNTNHRVSEILEAWLTSPDGRGFTDQLMFDTLTPYQSIRPVR
ncbi:hypothetical protein B0H11DRAFT_1618159, partial [Mycena galericulata]